MSEPCGRTFDEALISGYVDGTLVQGDAQRVQIHLEDCASCRALVDEITSVRETTISSAFATPADHEWPAEAPRSTASRTARRLGWPVLAAWAILVAGVGLLEAWRDADDLLERLILVAGVSGLSLLFLSVLLDRLKARKSDRYNEVLK
jgi:anti-sigma factor RsiW